MLQQGTFQTARWGLVFRMSFFIVMLALSLVFLFFVFIFTPPFNSIGDIIIRDVVTFWFPTKAGSLFEYPSSPVPFSGLLTFYIYACPFVLLFCGLVLPPVLKQKGYVSLALMSTIAGLLFVGDALLLVWYIFLAMAFSGMVG